MNTKINELIEQAGYIYDGGLVVPNIEKFAELIVKECADWVDNQGGYDGPCGNDLKEHFGVEE